MFCLFLYHSVSLAWGAEQRMKKPTSFLTVKFCVSLPTLLCFSSLFGFCFTIRPFLFRRDAQCRRFAQVPRAKRKRRETSFNTIIIIFPAPPRNRLVFEVVIATDVFLRCRRRFFGPRAPRCGAFPSRVRVFFPAATRSLSGSQGHFHHHDVEAVCTATRWKLPKPWR